MHPLWRNFLMGVGLARASTGWVESARRAGARALMAEKKHAGTVAILEPLAAAARTEAARAFQPEREDAQKALAKWR